MEYWKAFEDFQSLMSNDFWKGDHVPPAPSKEWLEYIYIVKIIANDSIIIQTDTTDVYKIGWSNDTSPIELNERMKGLKKSFGDVRLVYRWRLPAAQTFEKFILSFLQNFRKNTLAESLIRRSTTDGSTGRAADMSTEVIYNIPITTLVHVMQLCIICRATEYLTNKTGVAVLSDMKAIPTSIGDAVRKHTFAELVPVGAEAELVPGVEFNYTTVFRKISDMDIPFSIYPKGCIAWSGAGNNDPPTKFKQYIMNYTTDFDPRYDFDDGGGFDNNGDGGELDDNDSGEAKGNATGNAPENGNLLPLILYALRF